MNFPTISPEERARLLSPPLGRVPVVIDSDTYNEVDDQFAIAYALRSQERLDVQAIYAAPFTSMQIVGMVPEATSPDIGMELSHKEILRLLELLGGDFTGEVLKGSAAYLPDAKTPVESPAARDLVKRAHETEGPLYVLAIGAPTNVASAILMDPEIIKKIVVVWLGGHAWSMPYSVEFNLMQDIHASRLLFDSGVPLVQIPCMGVASHLTTTPIELQNSIMGSKIGAYLTKIVTDACKPRKMDFPKEAVKAMRETYFKDMDDYSDEVVFGFKSGQMALSRIIWDISAVGYVVNPNWCASKLQPAPLLKDDMSLQFSPGRHMVRYCHNVSRDAIFGDMFSKLSKD